MISSDTKCFNTCLAQTKGKFVFAASVDIKQCCKFSNFFLPKIKIKLLKFPVAMHGFLLHVVEMKGISSSPQQQHFVVYHFECHCILSLTFFFHLNCAACLSLATEMIKMTVIMAVDLIHRIIVTAPLQRNGSGAICKTDQSQTTHCVSNEGMYKCCF